MPSDARISANRANAPSVSTTKRRGDTDLSTSCCSVRKALPGRFGDRVASDCVRSRGSSMCPTCVVWPERPLVSWLAIQTSRSGYANGKGRSSRVLTTLKTVELAPMPRPAIAMAKTANPASRRRIRAGVSSEGPGEDWRWPWLF